MPKVTIDGQVIDVPAGTLVVEAAKPLSEKGGECPLPDHSLHYGPGKSRFYAASKFHNEKSVPLSPLIMLDRERCIQCARCIRFQDEIAGEPVLGFADRGRGLEITTF